MSDLGKLDATVTIFDEYDLGELIVSFYEQEISKTEADFNFVVPRKCLTEYKVMVNEGKIESVFSDRRTEGVGSCGTGFGTSKSFVLYIDKIKEMLDANEQFEIVVIDDIIVHGRGICQFLNKLLGCFSEADASRVREKIKVRAFVRNAEIPFLKEQYPDIYEDNVRLKTYVTYREPSALKRISDLFLNSFAMTMTSNTSFVNSWIIKENRGEGKLYNWLKEKLLKEKKDIYQEYVSHLNNYWISVFKSPEIVYFNNIVEFSCIRCYTSYLPCITLTPCVFLKPLTGEVIDRVYSSLLETSYGTLVSGFLNKIGSLKGEDVYILKLEYLIRVISEIYGCHFLKEFQKDSPDIKWSDIIEEDVDSLKFSYLDTYYSVNELFSAFNRFGNDREMVITTGNTEKYFRYEAESVSLFKEACFYRQGVDAVSFIDDYFSFNSDYDDKRAFDGKERLKGITPRYLKMELEQQNSVDDLIFYGHLSCCMDSGKAALTISCVDDYYLSVLRSGEQAYRLLTENNQWAIKYLSKIEESFINLCLQDWTASYMQKYIQALFEEKCIDEDDYKRLNYLSNEVEESRKVYFNKFDNSCNGAQCKLRRRTYMRDYYVERIEITPEPTYEEKLEKLYDRIMA